MKAGGLAIPNHTRVMKKNDELLENGKNTGNNNDVLLELQKKLQVGPR